MEAFLDHWGYLAIFLTVVLGNMGLPVPEESILALAGYLVWDGHLRLPLVLAVGVLSAVVGDNLGYWLGREYGRPMLERYGGGVLVTRERLEAAVRLVKRYGPLAVFVARFIPGLRFLAGPVAGITRLGPLAFLLANVAGALIYVPVIVTLGYTMGLALGPQLAAVERRIGQVEHYVLLLVIAATAVLVARRTWQRGRREGQQ